MGVGGEVVGTYYNIQHVERTDCTLVSDADCTISVDNCHNYVQGKDNNSEKIYLKIIKLQLQR